MSKKNVGRKGEPVSGGATAPTDALLVILRDFTMKKLALLRGAEDIQEDIRLIAAELAQTTWEALFIAMRQTILASSSVTLPNIGTFSVDHGRWAFTPDASLTVAGVLRDSVPNVEEFVLELARRVSSIMSSIRECPPEFYSQCSHESVGNLAGAIDALSGAASQQLSGRGPVPRGAVASTSSESPSAGYPIVAARGPKSQYKFPDDCYPVNIKPKAARRLIIPGIEGAAAQVSPPKPKSGKYSAPKSLESTEGVE